ncbi:TraR/DksA family transcriptional regulator [Pararhodobacter sp.]|uniref:TraR/DksA family transcriptional regulator n=1 Tax=Pararhodobacter sp. TaxID=2127056 RepID=UPI002FDCA3B6
MSDPNPDSAPEARALRDRYQPRLTAEAGALRAASGSSGERRPVLLDQQSVGRLSRLDAVQQQAMAAAQEVRRAGRLRAIEAALLRLEQEEFGWCDDCGDIIGLKRLDPDPLLMPCIACAG